MTFAGFILVAALATPLLLAALLGIRSLRTRALDLLPVAPLPALAAVVFAPNGSQVLAPAPLRIVLALDGPGAVLFGAAALLWMMAGLYARRYMAGDRNAARFGFWWLLTLAGSLGTFVVADVASFYLMFSLASLSAYGLVAHEGTVPARRAGYVYMALAILGEAFVLLAFVMLARGGDGNPLIAEAVARLPSAPQHGAVMVLLILGFGLKMGLVPLHVWMPLAHPVAPMPASAALSGIIVKAGLIGLIRFLPLEAGLAGWGTALAGIGLVTAFYAVAVGLTQQHPKTVLAYSTVSQMGFIATILGAGLASASPLTASVAAFYGLHHMLVKGALFLGVGILGPGGRYRTPIIVVMGVLAMSLAGLPLTSGALAKYAAKEVIGEGVAGHLATLSAAGSTLLMLHFLRMAAGKAADDAPSPALVLPWALTAAASLLVPWLTLATATGISPLATLGLSALVAALWPMLLGGLLAAALVRSGARLPRVAEGDLVVLAERAIPLAARCGRAIEAADTILRRWSVASVALVGIALMLGAALQWGR